MGQDETQEEIDRDFVLQQALSDNPLTKILRAILEEAKGRSLTDDEWRVWLENVI